MLVLIFVLDRGPVGLRRVADRGRDVSDERAEDRVVASRWPRSAWPAAGRNRVELRLVGVLVGEVQELLDRVLLAGAARLQRDDVVVDAERVGDRAGLARNGAVPVGGLEPAGRWMIGTTAGEPPTMPTWPWANSAQMSLRSVPPGLGSVSPA